MYLRYSYPFKLIPPVTCRRFFYEEQLPHRRMNALFTCLISLPGSQRDVDKFRCLRLRETGSKSYALD